MGTEDGTTVEGVVSEGTIQPAVVETVDPVAAKVKELLAKEREADDARIKRLVQSEADKRAEPLRRQLQEERSMRQRLEATLNVLPSTLGDLEPDVRARVENSTLRTRLSQYEAQDQSRAQAEREQQYRQQAHENKRASIARMGINPDDPRLVYRLDAATHDEYSDAVMESVAKIKEEDALKTIDAKVAERMAEAEARIRKATGVDSQDTGVSAGGTQTFTVAQISDREFYKAHKAEIQKARAEGRIKE